MKQVAELIWKKVIRSGMLMNEEKYMIIYCAKQAVERKIQFEDFLSPMISDYECAYACAKAAKILKIDISADISVAALKAKIDAAVEDTHRNRGTVMEENLFRLIDDYRLKGFIKSSGHDDVKEDIEHEKMPEEIPQLIKLGLESVN